MSLALGPLRLSSVQVDTLRQVTRRLVNYLLKSEVQLGDSWLPYSLKTSGNEWRDDYMVVPTVPVLLQLVTRYMPLALTDQSVLRLVDASLSESAQRDIGRARPYQMGNRDGIVNLLYYSDAYIDLEQRYRATGSSVWARIATTTHGVWRGYATRTMLAVLVLVTVGLFLGLLHSPTDIALGLIFALVGAYLAAVSAPPVVAFFWSDRYST
jgi:hypothetical protein